MSKPMVHGIAKLLLEGLELSNEVFLVIRKSEIMVGDAASKLDQLIDSNKALINLAKEAL